MEKSTSRDNGLANAVFTVSEESQGSRLQQQAV
jgi:hypothetical protein